MSKVGRKQTELESKCLLIEDFYIRTSIYRKQKMLMKAKIKRARRLSLEGNYKMIKRKALDKQRRLRLQKGKFHDNLF